MGLAKDLAVACSLAALAMGASSCASAPNAPGMAIVASSSTTSGPGLMLVAFPKTACTGTDSAVFIDDKGAFVASVAPGTATYLSFPDEVTRLYVVSSRDVLAPKGAWFRRHEIAAPGGRVDHGILVEVARVDAKNCYRTATPNPEIVTYEVATRAALPLVWLDVAGDVGTLWLDEHRARVTELLGQPPADPQKPRVTTITRLP